MTIMEKLMYNPYAWIVLSLCTIFSVIFAIYTWVAGRKIKEISVDKYSNEIVKQGKSHIDKLELKYAGKEIEDLSSIIFYIWNSGNDVINANDMVGENAISILSKNKQFLEAQILKQSDPSNLFQVTKFDPTNVSLKFDYLDSGEGVKIQILYTGSSDDFKVECKIKGGKAIRDCLKLRKDKGLKGLVKNVMDELVPMVLFTIGIEISYILSKVLGKASEYQEAIVLLGGIVITILLIPSYICVKSNIQKKFHRTIPIELKGKK